MKKAMVLVMSSILVIELISCHAYVDITGQEDFKAYQKKLNTYVMNLQTDQDSIIYFSEKFPGKMSKDEAVGFHQVLLDDFKPNKIIYKGAKADYAIKGNVRYRIVNRDSIKLVCITSDTLHIPFSEIKQMKIKKFDHGNTAVVVLGIAAGGAGLLYLIATNITFRL